MSGMRDEDIERRLLCALCAVVHHCRDYLYEQLCKDKFARRQEVATWIHLTGVTRCHCGIRLRGLSQLRSDCVEHLTEVLSLLAGEGPK